MKTHRIAVIPGDGIGKEVVPEGLRVLETAAAQVRHRARIRAFRLELRLLRQARPDDAGGLVRDAVAVRRDLLRRRRLARDGARPRVAVGLADPVPPPLRPVRQPAAVPADARHRDAAREPQARRHRLRRRAREHRGRVLVGRRPACSRAPSARSCSRNRCSRARASTASCKFAFELARDARRSGTSRRRPSRTASRSRCRTGTSAFARWPRDYPDIRADQYHIDILTAHFVAASADASTSSSARTCSATSCRISARPCAARSASRRRQHQSRAHVSVAVRAGARLGARHRGQGHRQSDRPDLVGRDDARVPRPPRRSARRRQRDRARARRSVGAAHGATSAASANTVELGKAIAAMI